MSQNTWRMYSDLAWLEPVIAPPEELFRETDLYARLIKEHASREVKTLLHLGCGAGVNDYHFKRQFAVTGVDISPGMLEQARKLNPEITYWEGDMRTVDLGEQFDAVAIPDSIGYMTTPEELQQALDTAQRHLKPAGSLLVVALVREDFQENNFCYTGSRGDVHVVIFENNFLPDPQGQTYESTCVFLVRQEGQLQIHTDHHVLGLFPRATWDEALRSFPGEMQMVKVPDLYDAFILGDNEYLLRVFVGTRR